jgi:MoxR-like ATPase
VGRVEAHPNFRFMAAGNTLMTGADEEYVTGQEIDASSRDRFAYFFEIDYSHEVELHISHGNEQIVSFVEDVRQAIKQTGIKHVVSYRATAAMIDEVENENDMVACCDESVFKTLDVDARREIYERLNDKTNVWAKAFRKLI